MRRYGISELRKKLSQAVSRADTDGERAIISRFGRDVAALVPFEELELLEWIEDQEDIKAAMRTLKKGEKGIPWEEAKKLLD